MSDLMEVDMPFLLANSAISLSLSDGIRNNNNLHFVGARFFSRMTSIDEGRKMSPLKNRSDTFCAGGGYCFCGAARQHETNILG